MRLRLHIANQDAEAARAAMRTHLPAAHAEGFADTFRELYRAGKATAVEVTDAETDLTRSRLDVVNSHVDERIARVALVHALGRDIGR